MPLLKTRASWNDIIHARTADVRPGSPVCMTCGRFVDSNGVVEGYPQETTWARYLVKHHGADELRTFDMGSTNWDYADVEQMARRTNWFDPRAHEGIAAGQRIESPDEHDGR